MASRGSPFASGNALTTDISAWRFSVNTLCSLPLDEIKNDCTPRHVRMGIFSEVNPTPLAQDEVKLIAASRDVLVNVLDMDPAISVTNGFVQFVSGCPVTNSTPLAHRYGGHQFGKWCSQLGDGRAHILGEYINAKGERWELQLKGSGLTPYSRDLDGRAVLRSSIREFLCSEAMYYLGVETTRSAALIVGSDAVYRDQFYSGQIRSERAAILLRVAPSWFRFGSLEILARQGELLHLKMLVDYIIENHFNDINLLEVENRYVVLFGRIAHRTVELAVRWQSLGFAHGVLNTDNMSILGLTIDYGPFGFVEAYDSKFVPNRSDRFGKYSLDKQLDVVLWNLEKLSAAFEPFLDENQRLYASNVLKMLGGYGRRKLRSVMRSKLGLITDVEEDQQLLAMLLSMMEETGADYTMTFRQLALVNPDTMIDYDVIKNHWSLSRLMCHDYYASFVEFYRRRLYSEGVYNDAERKERMNAVNPLYVLRNWMAQSAIEKAEQNDFSEVVLIQKILETPYSEQIEAEQHGYAASPPSLAYRLRISCSS
ncbi:protein adenylyltransferase SelO-like [Neodiprion virginianus]|uniref:protein adenylyltransferase SelO-like n=1 Tax=Neodiprion virginianus TaxID=2961670 RepID=UPI001EE6FD8A|nr:protein adenylyltransferase SelO-like [Neodiprion virginianus]